MPFAYEIVDALEALNDAAKRYRRAQDNHSSRIDENIAEVQEAFIQLVNLARKVE